MSSPNEIRELIRRYIAGSIDVNQFRQTFVPLFSDSGRSGNEAAFDLAVSVDSSFAEFVENLISETEFKSRLGHLAPVAINRIEFGFAAAAAGTTSPSVNPQASSNWPRVGERMVLTA